MAMASSVRRAGRRPCANKRNGAPFCRSAPPSAPHQPPPPPSSDALRRGRIDGHRKPAGIAHNPHELGIIARADRSSAFLIAGRDKRHRIECETELAARAAAQRLADEHRKPAMVYAIAGQSSAMLGIVQPSKS